MATTLTNEERKKRKDSADKQVAVITGICAGYICAYLGSMMVGESASIAEAGGLMAERLQSGKLFFQLNSGAFLGILLGAAIGFLMFLYLKNERKRKDTYKEDEQAGNAHFMSEDDKKKYAEKYLKNNAVPPMIMSEHFFRPMENGPIGNSNVFCVGGSGAGKSRYFLKPQILEFNASFVITDPSGDILNKVGTALAENGYTIKIFNLSDMMHSNCYNPLKYVRDEAGVNMVVNCLIDNTNKEEGATGDNQFFEDAEKLLYCACIFYLKDHSPDKSKANFGSIVSMINSAVIDENDPSAQSELDRLFASLPNNSLAVKFYKAFKKGAGRTLKSIVISCMTRLQPFITPQVASLTSTDNIELDRLGTRKTALFIITPQADMTYSFLSAMLYSQAVETLYYLGEQREAEGKGLKSPIPIRFLLDEFANTGKIPDFQRILATVRRYNISITVILQDLSQLEAMYKDDWRSIVANCSTNIFLGTTEKDTLKYYSELLGTSTIRVKSTSSPTGGKGNSSNSYSWTSRPLMTPDELATMDQKKCIVFTQNMNPVLDNKHPYVTHPNYWMTGDSDSSRNFPYKTYSIYDTVQESYDAQSITKARMEGRRYMELMKRRSEMSVQDTKDVKVDAAETINNLEIDKAKQRAVMQNYVDECLMKIPPDPEGVCVVTIDCLRTRDLYPVAKKVLAVTGLGQIVVCSSTEIPGYPDVIFGAGADLSGDTGAIVSYLEDNYDVITKIQDKQEAGCVWFALAKTQEADAA